MDIEKFKQMLKFSSVVGAIPYGQVDEKIAFFPVSGLIFSIPIALLLCYDTVLWVKDFQEQTNYDELKMSNISWPLLRFLSNICRFSMVFLTITNNVFQRYKWKEFLQNYFYINSILVGKNITHSTNHNICAVMFSIMHVFLVIHAIAVFVIRDDVFFSLIIILVNYYSKLIEFILFSITLSIHCRYKDLVNNLNTASLNQFLNVNVFNQHLTKVGKHCRLLKETLDIFNDLYGWSKVFIHGYGVMLTLIRIDDLLLGNAINTWRLLDNCVFAAYDMMTILASDLVVSEAEKISRLCHKLVEQFPGKTPERQELFTLANKCDYFVPVFSAAGFFTVRRSTIFDLLSIMTTYLIIIIQFNNG